MIDSPDALLPMLRRDPSKSHFSYPNSYGESTTYPDWVAGHDPEAAGMARDLTREMRSELRELHTWPRRFLNTMKEWAEKLPPAHLPWFWDTVGHQMIAKVDSDTAHQRAYAAAREAEATYGLPVDPGYIQANALRFAIHGALSAKQFRAHQRFLAETMEPVAAHAALEAFLTAWVESPAELPADLVRRVRVSAKAAGHGDEEVARVVGAALARRASRKATKWARRSASDVLLTSVSPLLAAHPPADTVASGLLELFPTDRVDGGEAWLRMLIDCGAAEAMVTGRLVPQGGPHKWVGDFLFMYQALSPRPGRIWWQPLPEEFLDLIGRLGPRLRAAGDPVTLHTGRYDLVNSPYADYCCFDADVLDTCLAAGIAVVDPGPEVPVRSWGERSRRDLTALSADPVFGPRLEGAVDADWDPQGRQRRSQSQWALPPVPGPPAG